MTEKDWEKCCEDFKRQLMDENQALVALLETLKERFEILVGRDARSLLQLCEQSIADIDRCFKLHKKIEDHESDH